MVKLDAKRPWEIERGSLDLHKVVLLSGYSFFILTGYDHAGGKVRNSYSRRSLIDMLTTGT